MKRYKIWCAWLLVWIICCTGSALAESRYNALSAGSNVVREDVAAWIEIPSTVTPRASWSSFGAASGARPASARAAAMRSAVRTAVPDGESTFRS